MKTLTKIAVGGIIHETNSFVPGVTTADAFRGEWVLGTESYLQRYAHTRTLMGGVIDRAMMEGAELACGFTAVATPSGLVTREAFEEMLDLLVETLDREADGVLLTLHGAMAAEGYPDAEAEILRRVREKIGADKPLAITLDLHANTSRDMVEMADLIVGYDTYPHVDAYDRTYEAMMLLCRLIRGEIRPVHAFVKPQLLIIPSVMMTEEDGAMRDIMQAAFALEKQPKVLNITVAGGFPYSDVPDAGMSVVVTTDGDAALAERIAQDLNRFIWERRDLLRGDEVPAEEAVRQAYSEEEGLVILVEASDNVGGGAPGDATHVLRHLLQAPKPTLIYMWDPEASALAHKIGVGGRFSAKVGGKSGPLHGEPVSIEGTVRLLSDGKYVHVGEYMTGTWADMGRTAVIEAGNLTLVVTSKRNLPFDPAHVTCLGLQATDYHVIVVKSAIAWRTAFESICKKAIVVDSPGCCGSDLHQFAYERLKRPIYPLDSL